MKSDKYELKSFQSFLFVFSQDGTFHILVRYLKLSKFHFYITSLIFKGINEKDAKYLQEGNWKSSDLRFCTINLKIISLNLVRIILLNVVTWIFCNTIVYFYYSNKEFVLKLLQNVQWLHTLYLETGKTDLFVFSHKYCKLI